MIATGPGEPSRFYRDRLLWSGDAGPELGAVPGDEPGHCRGDLQRARSRHGTARKVAGDREYGVALERRGHRARQARAGRPAQAQGDRKSVV